MNYQDILFARKTGGGGGNVETFTVTFRNESNIPITIEVPNIQVLPVGSVYMPFVRLMSSTPVESAILVSDTQAGKMAFGNILAKQDGSIVEYSPTIESATGATTVDHQEIYFTGDDTVTITQE